MLQVQVKLKMEQPKCRARVELLPRKKSDMFLSQLIVNATLSNIRWLVAALRRLRKENAEHGTISDLALSLIEYRNLLRKIWNTTRETGGKNLLYQPAVIWENAEGTVKLGEKFTKELVAIALEAVTGKYLGYGELTERMAEFYNRWGPIFKEKTVEVNDIWHRLTLLAWTAVCWRYLPANFPALNNKILDHILIKPLERTKEMWARGAELSNWSGFILYGYSLGEFSFAPVEKGKKIAGDGYRVFIPAKLPDWKRLDGAVSWVRKVVLSNVKEILNSVEYKTYVDSEGNLQLIAQPRDAYSLALLRIIWGNGSKLRKCACGCGLHTFTKWYHPSHQRRGQVKQNVLAYWRTQKNRGKISEGEYELIKAEINRLWSEEIKEKGKLAEAVKAFVTKNHPRP